MEDRLAKLAGIIEAGSFTRAAAQMHISQPALTAAVKKLERELDAELLIRSNGKLTLTAAGAAAYETAKKLAVETQNLHMRIGEAVKRNAILNLGLIDSLANLLFIEGDYLARLEQNVQLSLTIDNSSRLIERVNHNELDIALVAQPEKLPRALAAGHVGDEPLTLVTLSENADDARSSIASGHIRHFISYNQASRTHTLITGHFARHGISVDPTFYSTSPEIMLQLVLAGRGMAVLPFALVRPLIKQKVITPVAIGGNPVINRTIICLRRTGKLGSGPAEAVLTHASHKLKSLNLAANRL